MDYCWIQKSTIQNTTSRSFKIIKNQLSHINHSYIILPTACTTIENVDLNWDDFVNFYKLSYSNITIYEQVISKFLDLFHFLDSWVVYKEEKKYTWWG
jgi:hypothetical protein